MLPEGTLKREIQQDTKANRMPKLNLCLTAAAVACLICFAAAAQPARAADEDLALHEQDAFKAAVDRVGPSVVKIETIGGLEHVGSLLIGTGPTTGVAVSADGYIISSAFNFIQKPAETLIQLDDKTRLPATIVATDHSRMLVLLKVKMPSGKPSHGAGRRAEIGDGGRGVVSRPWPHV